MYSKLSVRAGEGAGIQFKGLILRWRYSFTEESCKEYSDVMGRIIINRANRWKETRQPLEAFRSEAIDTLSAFRHE